MEAYATCRHSISRGSNCGSHGAAIRSLAFVAAVFRAACCAAAEARSLRRSPSRRAFLKNCERIAFTTAASWLSQHISRTKLWSIFSLVQRKQFELAERGEAGAGIVEGDADAAPTQHPQLLGHLLFMAQDDVLGDFEFQRLRRQARLDERPLDGFDQIAGETDRLTETLKSSMPAARHSAACAQAVRTTQSPTSAASGRLSSTPMKAAGASRPRSGCRQRRSASAPTSELSRSRTCG